MEQWINNMWPKNEPLSKRILILSLSIFHLLVVIFIFTGWIFIPPKYPYLQIFYILVLFSCIFLFLCLGGCILTLIRKVCYSTDKNIKDLHIMPNIGKRFLMASWLIFLIIAIHNYYNPDYSVYNLIFRLGARS